MGRSSRARASARSITARGGGAGAGELWRRLTPPIPVADGTWSRPNRNRHMAPRKKSFPNPEHDGAIAPLLPELRNCAEPATLADALTRIKKQKKLPALVKHQSFPTLAETLVQKMSEWEPATRAAGLSILGRLTETVRTIRATREAGCSMMMEIRCRTHHGRVCFGARCCRSKAENRP